MQYSIDLCGLEALGHISNDVVSNPNWDIA